MSQQRSMIELAVFQGDTLIARQSFDQEKVIMGRISSADFRIPTPQVSRIHALLEIQADGSLKLTDLASTHGTYVNGSRIVEVVLKENDQVKIADATLKITRLARPTAQPEPTAIRATSPGIAPAPKSPTAKTTVPQKSPSKIAPAPVVASGGGEGMHASTTPREATVIRSLKHTATSRGVMEPGGVAHEELEVTVYWEDTILAIDHYKKGRDTISLGDGIKSTYIVTDSAIPQHYKFVELRGNRVELNLHPSMKMSARINGHMYTQEDLNRSGKQKIELSGNDIAKVRIGTINFFLMFVPDPPALPKGHIIERDAVYWSFFVSTFLLAFLVMTYMLIFQKPIEGEVKEFPEKFRQILVAAYKEKKLPVQPVTQEAEKSSQGTGLEEKQHIPDAIAGQRNVHGGNEGEGKRSPGPEGKRGEKNATHETGVTVAPKVKGADSHKPGPSTGAGSAANGKSPSKYGLLQSLKNSGLTSKLAKMTGPDGGNDDLNMKFSGFGGGGLQSARGVSPRGGLQGTGSGGGGKEPVVGVGGLGTKGFGEGAKGDGLGGIPGKGNALISTESGGISVGAGLSKEEIDRVVRAHMSELNFCLQQAKQRNAGVGGKLALKWMIKSGGTASNVTMVDNSTGDAVLANCFATRLPQWKWPSPPSGASAEVEYYPFTIK